MDRYHTSSAVSQLSLPAATQPPLQGAAEPGSDMAAFRLDLLTLMDQRCGRSGWLDGGGAGSG